MEYCKYAFTFPMYDLGQELLSKTKLRNSNLGSWFLGHYSWTLKLAKVVH